MSGNSSRSAANSGLTPGRRWYASPISRFGLLRVLGRRSCSPDCGSAFLLAAAVVMKWGPCGGSSSDRANGSSACTLCLCVGLISDRESRCSYSGTACPVVSIARICRKCRAKDWHHRHRVVRGTKRRAGPRPHLVDGFAHRLAAPVRRPRVLAS